MGAPPRPKAFCHRLPSMADGPAKGKFAGQAARPIRYRNDRAALARAGGDARIGNSGKGAATWRSR